MLLFGQWSLGTDKVLRPVIAGKIRCGDGVTEATLQLGGVGGEAPAVVIDTQIQFLRQDNVPVTFSGRFAAVTVVEALDTSVLGRDITNLFAVIVDRPKDVVCLLGPRHQYTITEL